MHVFIHYFAYFEKGVKRRSKNFLTQSVWKDDFQTSIHLELIFNSYLAWAEKYSEESQFAKQEFSLGKNDTAENLMFWPTPIQDVQPVILWLIK